MLQWQLILVPSLSSPSHYWKLLLDLAALRCYDQFHEMFRHTGLEPFSAAGERLGNAVRSLEDMADALDGRVVLITGAARGLGRATAERFLARGAQVAVNVRTPERAEVVAHELGNAAHPAPGDINNAETVRAIVAAIIERFGRLDVLVNNAALALPTRFEQITEDEWRATMDTNLTAAFLCTQAVVPSMKTKATAGLSMSHPRRDEVSARLVEHTTRRRRPACWV